MATESKPVVKKPHLEQLAKNLREKIARLANYKGDPGHRDEAIDRAELHLSQVEAEIKGGNS